MEPIPPSMTNTCSPTNAAIHGWSTACAAAFSHGNCNARAIEIGAAVSSAGIMAFLLGVSRATGEA